MDLTEFLLARLAEDEQVARAADEKNPSPWSPHMWRGEPTGLVMSTKVDHLDGALWDNEGVESLSMQPVTAAHVSRHDPARVLAEVEAKRQIIAEHPNGCPYPGEGWDYCLRCEDRNMHDAMRWPCPTLRFLAVPYADHADYLPEWAPEVTQQAER